MILATHIDKSFGGIRALRDVSLVCEPGTIIGLVGPNGSGKSTFVNVLTQMLPLDQGRVTLEGGFGRTFQDVRVWEHMTVLENILLATQARGLFSSLAEFHADDSRARKAIIRVGLSEYADVQAKHLSYGQRKLLEIARVLGTGASNLFLDEPFAGLFPKMVECVKSIIIEERERGASIVLIEHDMSVIRELCDRVVVLDAGSIIAEGNVEEVLKDPDVILAYLGE